jgi:hypothetical protein
VQEREWGEGAGTKIFEAFLAAVNFRWVNKKTAAENNMIFSAVENNLMSGPAKIIWYFQLLKITLFLIAFMWSQKIILLSTASPKLPKLTTRRKTLFGRVEDQNDGIMLLVETILPWQRMESGAKPPL